MADQGHSPPPWPRVSVVIPTLNEARNLPRVFAALPPDTYEVIVADGHSVDDTVAVVRELRPEAHVVMQARPGRYSALASGCAAATGDVIALINADGSTDAAEIPGFVSALLAGADFAKGTRFAPGGGSEDMSRLRGFGNRVLTRLVNVLYGTRYTDLSGFIVFWQKHLSALGLDAAASLAEDSGHGRGNGLEIETLISIRAAAAGLSVVEVPSLERSRMYGVSDLGALTDGLRVLRMVIRQRFSA
jgi:glycosyltransferase involved in cell wall biosynthesis